MTAAAAVTTDLSGRSFLKESDFSVPEWMSLLDLARDLKTDKRTGLEQQHLAGRNIALIFEKTSTRTRCAFEVAAYDQGAHVTYLDPQASQLGHKETVADTARVLGRMYDGIEYRGFAQSTVEDLAIHSGVPVFNGLTDQWHPTQSLCDVLTMTEHVGPVDRPIVVGYLGDCRNNVANSLLVAGAMAGMDVRMIGPKSRWPTTATRHVAEQFATHTGASLQYSDDPLGAVTGCDFLYTDVWLSMGEPQASWDERIDALLPFQVNAEMMRATGNPDVRFMHCLPAFHNTATDDGARAMAGRGLTALEVTDEVFESPQSIVFDQAENRLHTIKAVLVAALGR
ncbi:ornithine carbamoyltransferase [Williamsia sp. 1135]|uniref:ornithine carbamoyltransferase n=1 Tax=Williamsia sp. 1135 TaxID=1889262 RepID=UPI000A1075EB|nr:ornithine carbamoyltransferase [Williamsia sp. 1135]ORM36763.1 ornithine carbamoyltransferase [Williamsia sp. 1135]